MPSTAAKLHPAIHPTAVVHSTAVIGNNVCIGEFALIEAGVKIGDDCHIAAHTVLRAGCELGNAVSIDSFCVIAGLPQMRDYEPSPGKVSIGDHTILREAVTINLPAKQSGVTSIGSDCYLMANCHVGHDSSIGNSVTLANNVMLAGHVTIGDSVFLGGGAGVHQFVRIGEGSMISGNSSISYDVPPFAMAAERNEISGLNLIGIRRSGIAREAVADLKRCFHSVFCGPGNLRERAAEALSTANCGSGSEGRRFLEFFAGGKRGFVHQRQGRHHN